MKIYELRVIKKCILNKKYNKRRKPNEPFYSTKNIIKCRKNYPNKKKLNKHAIEFLSKKFFIFYNFAICLKKEPTNT